MPDTELKGGRFAVEIWAQGGWANAYQRVTFTEAFDAIAYAAERLSEQQHIAEPLRPGCLRITDTRTGAVILTYDVSALR